MTAPSDQQPPTASEPPSAWTLCTPAGERLQITRTGRGWDVLFGGFSRSAGPSLNAALVEATGTHDETEWINELANTIQPRHLGQR